MKQNKFSYSVSIQVRQNVFQLAPPKVVVQDPVDGFDSFGQAVQGFVQRNIYLGDTLCHQPCFYADECGDLVVSLDFWMMQNPQYEMDPERFSCIDYLNYGLMLYRMHARFFRNGKPVKLKGNKTVLRMFEFKEEKPVDL